MQLTCCEAAISCCPACAAACGVCSASCTQAQSGSFRSAENTVASHCGVQVFMAGIELLGRLVREVPTVRNADEAPNIVYTGLA